MALRKDNAIAKAMERDIVHRYELRGITKELSAAERRKVTGVATMIEGLTPDRTMAVMRAFLDYTFPVGSKAFKAVRNLYFEWRQWSVEVYPTIEHLFPVTTEDEDIISCFFADWRALREDRNHYRTVYRRPSMIGGAKLAPAYRHTPDFFRVLAVLRDYQQDPEMAKYPLFTMRAYLAAQVEALSGFVAVLKIGNIVSEKAKLRFDEWYLYRFYNLELVKKGLRRPSDNNPVSNVAVRRDYEGLLVGKGRGDFTFNGETPVPWMTRPAQSFGGGEVSVEFEEEHKGIKMPPGMGDVLE